jgi:hypothetical protein
VIRVEGRKAPIRKGDNTCVPAAGVNKAGVGTRAQTIPGPPSWYGGGRRARKARREEKWRREKSRGEKRRGEERREEERKEEERRGEKRRREERR